VDYDKQYARPSSGKTKVMTAQKNFRSLIFKYAWTPNDAQICTEMHADQQWG
jgi:hypothetical protein